MSAESLYLCVQNIVVQWTPAALAASERDAMQGTFNWILHDDAPHPDNE